MADQAPPVLDTILAARSFRDKDKWFVDNSNYLAAILAFSDKKPSELQLVARDDAVEEMPSEVLEEICRKKTSDICRTTLRFADSFCKPRDTDRDRKRLGILTADKSFELIRFYGYLDGETIGTLPKTISSLGLAIKNEKDAEAVSSLKAWAKLKNLNVSVSSDVAVRDLRQLNSSLHSIKVFLTFPYLSDESVDNVRPAIDALSLGIKVFELYFPKSKLTEAGVRSLALQLGPVKPTQINIDPCGTWQPNEAEKNSVKKAFSPVVKNVNFDVDWLNKER